MSTSSKTIHLLLGKKATIQWLAKNHVKLFNLPALSSDLGDWSKASMVHLNMPKHGCASKEVLRQQVSESPG